MVRFKKRHIAGVLLYI